MKKYTINVYGYGCEITIGRLTEDQTKLISEADKEDLYDVVWEDDFGHWAETDDIYHNFGASDCSTLTVEDEERNEVFKIDLEDYFEEGILEYEDKYFSKEDVNCIVCCSQEKGNFFSGEIEIDGDFDPAKLRIVMHEDVGLEDCYLYGNLIGEITYDGEEIDNWGGDTTGKSFDIKVNF
jgi:hypothetical protein